MNKHFYWTIALAVLMAVSSGLAAFGIDDVQKGTEIINNVKGGHEEPQQQQQTSPPPRKGAPLQEAPVRDEEDDEEDDEDDDEDDEEGISLELWALILTGCVTPIAIALINKKKK